MAITPPSPISRRAFLASTALALPAMPDPRRLAFHSERRPRTGWNLASRFNGCQIDLLSRLNRADRLNLPLLKEMAIPQFWDLPGLEYGPFPLLDTGLRDYAKVLIADIPNQALGAYESGALVHWAPISSGAAANPTPEGVYHLNWKSKGRHSTVDPDWFMPYYFNFDNRNGLSLHAYTLPGRPASHSCIRLLDADARWLYEWGEGWELDFDGRTVLRHGTTLWVNGRYAFDAPPPWIQSARPADTMKRFGAGPTKSNG